MQSALSIAPPVVPLLPSKHLSQLTLSPSKLSTSSRAPCPSAIKAAATTVAHDTSSTVDYSSLISVFPAEACETIGGDACLADIFPEVKLEVRNEAAATIASEPFDREHLEYNDEKTVFCAEACDDLGGEFCSREYQRGVY